MGYPDVYQGFGHPWAAFWLGAGELGQARYFLALRFALPLLEQSPAYSASPLERLLIIVQVAVALRLNYVRQDYGGQKPLGQGQSYRCRALAGG
jgi:hypothetical protein